MDKAALAQQFNSASEALDAVGHKIIVRRARAFLEAGEVDGAIAFLEEAHERLSQNGIDIGALVDGLKAFRVDGGDVDRLVTEPAWLEGSGLENHLPRLVESAVSGGDLRGLIQTLAEQQRALAAGEPLGVVPEPKMAPEELPPLPMADELSAMEEVVPLEAPDEPSLSVNEVVAEVADAPAPVPAEPSGPALVEVEAMPEPVSTPTDVESKTTGRTTIMIALLLIAIGAGAAAFFFLTAGVGQ